MRSAAKLVSNHGLQLHDDSDVVRVRPETHPPDFNGARRTGGTPLAGRRLPPALCRRRDESAQNCQQKGRSKGGIEFLKTHCHRFLVHRPLTSSGRPDGPRAIRLATPGRIRGRLTERKTGPKSCTMCCGRSSSILAWRRPNKNPRGLRASESLLAVFKVPPSAEKHPSQSQCQRHLQGACSS